MKHLNLWLLALVVMVLSVSSCFKLHEDEDHHADEATGKFLDQGDAYDDSQDGKDNVCDILIGQ